MNEKLAVCSVLMITYNHEKYIAEAIDSVIMQKTNFDYVIVIGEDCSTDKTREIVLEYKAKYPNKIKLLLQEKNVGMMQNFIDTLKVCSGKYIAMLEGDDYWTDPYKLQKQVDFLEANPEYGLVHTNCLTSLNGITHPIQNDEKIISGYIFEELIIHKFFISTLTVCGRNDLLTSCSKELYEDENIQKWEMGDYPLWLEAALRTKIKYMKEPMAVYRKLPESASHSNNKSKRYKFFLSIYDIKFFYLKRQNIFPEQKTNIIKNMLLQDYYSALLSYSNYNRKDALTGLIFLFNNDKLKLKDLFRFMKNFFI